MTALRFRPPEFELSEELRWVLLRAFGPAGGAGIAVASGEAERLAERLDLVPRIAARQGRERLVRELGADAASRFMDRAHAAAGLGLRIEGLARELAEIAQGSGIPVVFLKFAALHLSGALVPGSRTCCDLDILVPSARAGEFRDALLRLGYGRSNQPDYEHQLGGIRHPSGAFLEIHTCLLGVRLEGKRSADFDALSVGGLLQVIPGYGPLAAVPVPDVVAAHAIVHGLAQHGYIPESYPALRMLADVSDLPCDAGRERWARWISRDVGAAEVEALLDLRRALQQGTIPPRDDDAGLLLRHLLAGLLDTRYGGALRLSGVFREVTDHGRVASLLRQCWHALVPSEAELGKMYGPAPTLLARLGQRVRRPLDVVRKLTRYAAQSLSARGKTGRVAGEVSLFR